MFKRPSSFYDDMYVFWGQKYYLFFLEKKLNKKMEDEAGKIAPQHHDGSRQGKNCRAICIKKYYSLWSSRV
jgi:hypothetical protein